MVAVCSVVVMPYTCEFRHVVLLAIHRVRMRVVPTAPQQSVRDESRRGEQCDERVEHESQPKGTQPHSIQG